MTEPTAALTPERFRERFGRYFGGCAMRPAPRSSSALRGVRRVGMMFALDFADAATGMAFLGLMSGLGVLVVASSQRLDVVKLYPPLILEPAHVAEFSEKMESALKSLT